MKNFLLIVCIVFASLTGCAKKEMGCTPVSPAAEEPQIKAYDAANNIGATKDSSGIYYKIVDSGTGVIPTLDSKIYLTYVGKLLNGQKFDERLDASQTGWKLSSLIEGWQLGIPLIRKGGKIRLIIPSSFGYGCIDNANKNSAVSIPANSVLFFDISLIDVQ